MSENDQGWVDGIVYYRNLAISLGATPDQMLNPTDWALAERGLTIDEPGYWTHEDEERELWEMWKVLNAIRDRVTPDEHGELPGGAHVAIGEIRLLVGDER